MPPPAVRAGRFGIRAHIPPDKEIKRRTRQQQKDKLRLPAGIHQDTADKKYNFSVFYRGEIKNNQKNRQEPKKEFQTAEYKAILTHYLSYFKSCHILHSKRHF